jgi:SAM-dependent methyltransferase
MQTKKGNDEQIEYWNGDAGATWTRRQDRMDAMLAPIGDATLERCPVNAGDKVLDVGCGCGDTTLRFAARGAIATGVDISKPMLARARERAAAKGLAATFTLADAAEARFDTQYDVLFSRFGVMFFSDPTAAFTNLHRALRASARLCFVCWQPPRLNPWISVPFAAAQPLLPPQPTLEPRAPGPFAFAEPDYVREILTGAGFKSISIDPLTTTLTIGSNIDDALEQICEVGPLSRSLADVDPSIRTRVIAAVREQLQPNLTSAGVALGAACWIVRAAA